VKLSFDFLSGLELEAYRYIESNKFGAISETYMSFPLIWNNTFSFAMFRGAKNFQHFLQLNQIVFLYDRTSNTIPNFVHTLGSSCRLIGSGQLNFGK